METMRPNRVLVADMTYSQIQRSFTYVFAVLDQESRWMLA